jgi:hypothetical protein
MRCERKMDCATLIARWRAFDACVRARQELMARCFRGGDAEHRRMLKEYERGQARCEEFMLAQGCDMSWLCP